MNRATIPTDCKVLVFRATPLMLLAGVLIGGSMAWAQTAAPSAPATPTATAAPTAQPAVAGTPTRVQPVMVPRRAAMYYESAWGVDSLSVKAVESGELIRFTYRILDPAKSALLNDKKFEPSLIFPGGHVKLVVPSLENVGALRQSSAPIAGKLYWMAFSNPGRTVKKGDRVDVEIGQFRAEGLIVQ